VRFVADGGSCAQSVATWCVPESAFGVSSIPGRVPGSRTGACVGGVAATGSAGNRSLGLLFGALGFALLLERLAWLLAGGALWGLVGHGGTSRVVDYLVTPMVGALWRGRTASWARASQRQQRASGSRSSR